MLLFKCHIMTFLGKYPNSFSHQFFQPPPPTKCIFKQGALYLDDGKRCRHKEEEPERPRNQSTYQQPQPVSRPTRCLIYVHNSRTAPCLISGWCYLRSRWWREDKAGGGVGILGMMFHVLMPALVTQVLTDDSSHGTFWCMPFSVGIINTV